jgi:Trk K+ transport system NAD-binding subunit
VAHRPLKESWKRALGKSIVGAVLRAGEMLIPTGNTVLQPGDIVIVFTRAAGIRRVRKLFGSVEQSSGGGHA